MTKSDLSRLIFIDSSVNTHGDHAKVLVPPHPFGAVGSERIALTLISFCQRRNWYNVNATNNTFYLFQNGVHYEVQIAPGVYSNFSGAGGLGPALEVALPKATMELSSLTEQVRRRRRRRRPDCAAALRSAASCRGGGRSRCIPPPLAPPRPG